MADFGFTLDIRAKPECTSDALRHKAFCSLISLSWELIGLNSRAGPTEMHIHSRRRRALISLFGAGTVQSLGFQLPPGREPRDEIHPSRVLQVGLTRTIKSVAEASVIARDGDQVVIDPGEYSGDVATWRQSDLSLVAASGRVRLVAAGQAAEEKAIWVIKGDNVLVEGIDFTGARVPDHNGAGIRHEGGKLELRGCRFTDNETGVLTSNDQRAELDVVGCEFGHNGAGDGQSHNLYVGTIARLTVRGSYFHHCCVGHLLKTRAERSDIRYSRLTDEEGGRASYELEFPNGGSAIVLGNIIQQGPQTENGDIVSFGAEGMRWPHNELQFINNTIVNDYRGRGVFMRIRGESVYVSALNNVLVGYGAHSSGASSRWRFGGNIVLDRKDMAAPESYDYHLKSTARAKLKRLRLRNVAADLQPDSEYIHPLVVRKLQYRATNPGALQTLVP